MLDIDALLKAESLYTTYVSPYEFTWRLLTIREYKVFSALRKSVGARQDYITNKVFEHCYIGEASLLPEHIPAGVTSSIGEFILYLSGDCEYDIERVKLDIHEAREKNPGTTLNEVMQNITMIAFPDYTPRKFEDLTRQEFYELFVRAEQKLMVQNPEYSPLNLKAIKSANEKSGQESIDFLKENMELTRAQGNTVMRSEDKYMQKLERTQARKLDRGRR